jgi:hypothetical protein
LGTRVFGRKVDILGACGASAGSKEENPALVARPYGVEGPDDSALVEEDEDEQLEGADARHGVVGSLVARRKKRRQKGADEQRDARK